MSDDTPSPGLPRRLLDTILSPGKMVEAVVRDPRWLGALLVAMVLIAVSTALIPPEMFAEVQRRAALARGVTPPPMTERTLHFIRYFAIAGSALGVGIMAFLITGIYTFFFAFILGDEGRYKQYLAVFTHSMFIPGVVSIFLAPLRIRAGDPQLTLNVGTFLFFLTPGYIANVFRFLDLTQLWAMVVVALGAHAIDRRRGVASALTIMLCFTLVIALILATFVST